MHRRIAIHEVSFPQTMSLDAILDWSASNGVPSIGLFSLRREKGWGDAASRVAGAPVSVAYLCHASMFALDDPSGWDRSSEAVMATIDAAAAMGTRLVYATTGAAGGLEFEQAADALVRAVAPLVAYAREKGVKLLIETANPVFAFTHFLHSFRDTVDVARSAGLGVCLDLHPTWHERGLRRQIAAAADLIEMVQVADHIPRNLTVSRDVVGTGIIPIERLLKTLFDAGFDGPVDLELFGRPAETALDDILESAERLSAILEKVEA